MAFVEITSPCVLAVETPVAGERDGGDDEFPFHAGGFVASEEMEEGGELSGTEHCFVGRNSGFSGGGGPVATRVHHKEGCGTLCKGEV